MGLSAFNRMRERKEAELKKAESEKLAEQEKTEPDAASVPEEKPKKSKKE